MPITGMDIDGVRQLAAQMDNNAAQIEQLIGTLNGALESTEWIGPDRERFVGDWHGTFMPQLTTVANSLRDTANAARSNADQQEQASA
ncbi:hypothetical protein IN07_18430 [Modestobacter caceresii]|uniref:WXG100 family type VII secretion target n=1 Tax=Modestobacter caceresii TaxID=1522368 RepID=A0A098Y462_9ACTN|nr:WXG100 family type VII secretion target [Modestobacter caceresii]KGH45247.1 hypothetical protein IN07_18430 [Modestobacter caceresii]